MQYKKNSKFTHILNIPTSQFAIYNEKKHQETYTRHIGVDINSWCFNLLTWDFLKNW